jgi:hypothetical protein
MVGSTKIQLALLPELVRSALPPTSYVEDT